MRNFQPTLTERPMKLKFVSWLHAVGIGFSQVLPDLVVERRHKNEGVVEPGYLIKNLLRRLIHRLHRRLRRSDILDVVQDYASGVRLSLLGGNAPQTASRRSLMRYPGRKDGRALLLGRSCRQTLCFLRVAFRSHRFDPRLWREFPAAPAARHCRRLRSIALGLEHHQDSCDPGNPLCPSNFSRYHISCCLVSSGYPRKAGHSRDCGIASVRATPRYRSAGHAARYP